MSNYQEAKIFWEEVFKRDLNYNPTDEIKIKEIEEGLVFMGNKCQSLIDFGCGHGKITLRCLYLGTENVTGIDLCENAISLAQNIVKAFKLEERAIFKTGSLSSLEHMRDKSFNGAILFNILDNMTIDDGKTLLSEIHRLITTDGYILLKLNPFLTKDFLIENQLIEIEENLYKDPNGLYLWNICDEDLYQLLNDLFVIEKKTHIERKPLFERLFYLKKVN